MPSPSERVAVSESMNRDRNMVSAWCYLWGMKLNASKTKTMLVVQVKHSSSSVNSIKGKVFYGHELPSGESTTTECGVNYQLLAVY